MMTDFRRVSENNIDAEETAGYVSHAANSRHRRSNRFLFFCFVLITVVCVFLDNL